MLTDRALLQKVQQLLEDESRQLTRLHDLLCAETLALQNPDPTALADVIKQKAAPLAALEQSQRVRFELLNELQHTANEDGWRDLITQLDARPEGATQLLTPLLDALLQTLTQCRTVNLVNEKIVARSQHSVQHLLDIIRGNIPANKLYGATGNTVTLSDAKPITAA